MNPAGDAAGEAHGASGELLDAARRLAVIVDRRLGCSARVAAALLLRQEIEGLLGEYWARVAPGLDACSMRAQLAALPFYLEPAELAGRVALAWHQLSALCHHDAYELAPLPSELLVLAGTTDALRSAVASRTRDHAGQ